MLDNVNPLYMARKRTSAIQLYEKLDIAIEEARAAKNYGNEQKLSAHRKFMEFELQCLGVEMTPEQVRGDELTPDELVSGRWLERLSIGGLEYGELVEESCFSWADDDGNADSVDFDVEMDGEWWEAQFSVDAGVKSVEDALPGEPVETTWYPNWEHLRRVSEARNCLRDSILNRIDEIEDIKDLAKGCQVAKKYSVWAQFLAKGKRTDAYGNKIRHDGLDYRRFVICMNEMFRKACLLKGHKKAWESTVHLLYVDPDEKAERERLAGSLNTWAKQALGSNFRCYALLSYPERPSKEGDILDHAAQKGEHEMEDGDYHKANQQHDEQIEALEEYLAYRQRLNVIPKTQIFRMTPEEVMEWMTTPLKSSLTQPLEALFQAKKLVYIPPTPASMGF